MDYIDSLINMKFSLLIFQQNIKRLIVFKQIIGNNIYNNISEKISFKTNPFQTNTESISLI